MTLAYFALQVQVNANIVELIPTNAKVMQLLEKYSQGETAHDYLLVAVEPIEGELFTLENMEALDDVIRKIEKLPYVHGSINPFNLLTFQRQGSRLNLITISRDKRAPETEKDLKLYQARLIHDSLARNLIISNDLTSLCVILSVDFLDDYTEMLNAIDRVFADKQDKFKVYISGGITFNQATRVHLLRDVPKFLLMAIGIILIVFFTGFRTRRAVFLPFIIVSVGTIWTVGIMRLLGFSFTLVSIMTPPLVLTLGSAYTMHVLNQYYRESQSGSKDTSWIADAVAHINKTIILASLTTVIGFGSLLTATLEQVREFGVSTSIGIICSAALALFFLPAVLSRLKNPSAVQRERVEKGTLVRFLKKLGRFDIKYRIVVYAFLAVVVAAFLLTIKHITIEMDITSYFRTQERAVEDSKYIDRKYGGFVYLHVSLTAPSDKKGFFYDLEELEKISQFEESLKQYPDIVNVTSFVTYLRMVNRTMYGRDEIPRNRALVILVSRYLKAIASSPIGQSEIASIVNKEFTQLTINLRVYNSETKSMILEERLKEVINEIESEVEIYLDTDLNPEIWGHSLAALYLSETLTRDLLVSVGVSTILIFIVTSFALRSLLFGLYSLIPMLTGITLNFILMSIFNIPLDVVTIMFSSVAIGVGVDSSIHLLIQFGKQRVLYPDDIPRAIGKTLQTSGRAILLTLTSLVAGFLVLIFSSFLPIVYFGFLVSLVLLTTSLGALIILPAILSLQRPKQV